MDCIFTAYSSAVYYARNISADKVDWQIYRLAKTFSHMSAKPQYTFGGVVPWMLNFMGSRHGIQVAEAEHRYYTKPLYVQTAPNPIAMWIAAQSDFGDEVEEITLPYAIYLDLASQHALWSTRVPIGGVVIAAYQMKRKE